MTISTSADSDNITFNYFSDEQDNNGMVYNYS